jgi:hypothetical protein
MVGRIQFDGVNGTLTPNTGVARAELAVQPAPAGAELPDRAVTAGARAQGVPPELQTHLQNLGRIRRATEEAHADEALARELAELEAKLVLGGDRIRKDAIPDPAVMDEIESALDRAEALADRRGKVESKTPPLPGAKQPEDPAEAAVQRREQGERAPDVTVRKAKVLRRIQDALSRLGTLRNKVTGDSEGHYEKLLTLNSSVSGLNFARAQLADTTFSVATAADTVDAILVGVKTAVVAHGKISPDLVRLVL